MSVPCKGRRHVAREAVNWLVSCSMLKFRCKMASLPELTLASAIKRIWYFSSRGLSILHFFPQKVEQIFPARIFRGGLKRFPSGWIGRQGEGYEKWMRSPSRGNCFRSHSSVNYWKCYWVFPARCKPNYVRFPATILVQVSRSKFECLRLLSGWRT